MNKKPHYQWAGDTQFPLTGQQFEFLFQNFQAFLSSDRAKEVLVVAQAMAFLEQLLAKGIEDGTVVDINKEGSVQEAEVIKETDIATEG